MSFGIYFGIKIFQPYSNTAFFIPLKLFKKAVDGRQKV